MSILLLGGLAVAGAHSLKPSYVSTSSVLIRPVSGSPFSPDTATSTGAQLTVAMQTEAGLLDIPAVTSLASHAAQRTIPGTGESMKATVPAGTQIVTITYTAKTAALARQGAGSLATAFLTYRQQVAAAAQKASLASLTAQAKSADDSLKKATIAAANSPDVRSYPAQQVQLYAARLATLNDDISTLEAVSTDPGLVITAANLPGSSSGLSPAMVIAGGLVLGLFVGLALAVWREWRDDRVRADDEDEVRNAPVLVSLPRPTGDVELVTDIQASDRMHEAYRRLRLAVVASGPMPRVIAVSGVNGSLPTAIVTANVALALHEAGFRTVVVAADLDTPILERALDVPVSPGLAEIFLHGDELPMEIESPHGVRVVPRGENASAARELYAGSRFEFLIAGLKSEADYVLISAPPATTADGDAVAAVADSVILVGRDQVTTHAEVGSILRRYSRLGVNCLGLVFAAKVKSRLSLRSGASDAGRTKGPVAPEVATVPPAKNRPAPVPSVESLSEDDVAMELDDEDLEVPTGRRDEARVPDAHD